MNNSNRCAGTEKVGESQGEILSNCRCLGFSADFRPRSEKNRAPLLQKGDTGKTAACFVLWAGLAYLENRQIDSYLWDTNPKAVGKAAIPLDIFCPFFLGTGLAPCSLSALSRKEKKTWRPSAKR